MALLACHSEGNDGIDFDYSEMRSRGFESEVMKN